MLRINWTPRKTAASLLLAVVSSAPLAAQYGAHVADGLERTRQLVQMQLAHPQNADRKLINAEKRRIEFSRRLADFTKTWNSLMESKSNGKWDSKRAKAARKEFERLVRSQGWFEQSEAAAKAGNQTSRR